MARPLRIQYSGALYHVTVRGNEKKCIFLDNEDRYHFIRVLANTIDRYGWACYQYCLMDNHFHLVIETPEPNLSRAMKYLNGVYTQYFNWRHKRVGHLFQGRFKGLLVEKESYLRELQRYVPNNPVRAGMCSFAEDYPWSSVRAIMGLVAAPRFLAVDRVLELFNSNPAAARGAYASFLRQGQDRRVMNEVKGQIFLGSDEFVAQWEGHGTRKGVPKLQTDVLRPPLDRLLRDGDPRIAKAAGYTNTELAAALDVHRSTLWRRQNR